MDLFIGQFEQVSAVNGWGDYVSLVQLHHCLAGDEMSCGRHDDIAGTKQDDRAKYACHVKDASRKLSFIKQSSMSLHQLADEVHRLANVVSRVGRGEVQRICL